MDSFDVVSADFDSGRLLRELRSLKPGQCYRMEVTTLMDIQVPANPLDAQNSEYIARWMHARMPFYCTLHQGVVGGWWEIRRPIDAAEMAHIGEQ